MNKTKWYLLSLATIALATISVGLTFFFGGNERLTEIAFTSGMSVFFLAALFLPPILDAFNDQ